ncbi:MAG TPA: hypothetical protein VGK10_01080 [Prolixibacteraceae bacterium]|jgi:hypothetical protein
MSITLIRKTMVNLVLEDLFLGNPKIAPKEYPLPVAKITSHFKKVNEEQSSEKEVYSGSISLNEEAIVKLGYVPNGKETTSRLTVSSAKTAAFIYESSSLSIGKEGMKKLTDSRVLRISRTALEKIYSKHSLDVNDSWVFELVEGCIDLAGVKDLKVLVFKPLEKVA